MANHPALQNFRQILAYEKEALRSGKVTELKRLSQQKEVAFTRLLTALQAGAISSKALEKIQAEARENAKRLMAAHKAIQKVTRTLNAKPQKDSGFSIYSANGVQKQL